MAEKTILIVDDDELTLMLTEKILSAQYNTLRAASGPEAIELYGENHPDMVLADYMMPDMDGFQMLEKLHEIHGNRIPNHGAVDFIRKPLKADVLLKSVNTIMDRLSGKEDF